LCILTILADKRNQFSRKKYIKTLLFTDNQVTVADSADALPISVYKLETVTSKRGVKISKAKQKQWLLKQEIE
jgi:mRNA degradation ribonuclease J1/J2